MKKGIRPTQGSPKMSHQQFPFRIQPNNKCQQADLTDESICTTSQVNGGPNSELNETNIQRNQAQIPQVNPLVIKLLQGLANNNNGPTGPQQNPNSWSETPSSWSKQSQESPEQILKKVQRQIEHSIKDLDSPTRDDRFEVIESILKTALISLRVLGIDDNETTNSSDGYDSTFRSYSDYTSSTKNSNTKSRHSQTPNAVLHENDFKSKQESDIEQLIQQTRGLLAERHSIVRKNSRGRGRR